MSHSCLVRLGWGCRLSLFHLKLNIKRKIENMVEKHIFLSILEGCPCHFQYNIELQENPRGDIEIKQYWIFFTRKPIAPSAQVPGGLRRLFIVTLLSSFVEKKKDYNLHVKKNPKKSLINNVREESQLNAVIVIISSHDRSCSLNNRFSIVHRAGCMAKPGETGIPITQALFCVFLVTQTQTHFDNSQQITSIDLYHCCHYTTTVARSK